MSKLHHASAHRLATLALPLLAFAALFAILSAVNGSPPAPPTAASAALDAPAATQSTAQLVGELQAALGDDPSDPALYDQLGDAYYQRARETGDPAYYSRGIPAIHWRRSAPAPWRSRGTTSRPGSALASAPTGWRRTSFARTR